MIRAVVQRALDKILINVAARIKGCLDKEARILDIWTGDKEIVCKEALRERSRRELSG